MRMNGRIGVPGEPQAASCLYLSGPDNVHELTVTSDRGTFGLESSNEASADNPRSSMLAGQSIVAALRTLARDAVVQQA